MSQFTDSYDRFKSGLSAPQLVDLLDCNRSLAESAPKFSVSADVNLGFADLQRELCDLDGVIQANTPLVNDLTDIKNKLDDCITEMDSFLSGDYSPEVELLRDRFDAHATILQERLDFIDLTSLETRRNLLQTQVDDLRRNSEQGQNFADEQTDLFFVKSVSNLATVSSGSNLVITLTDESSPSKIFDKVLADVIIPDTNDPRVDAADSVIITGGGSQAQISYTVPTLSVSEIRVRIKAKSSDPVLYQSFVILPYV